MINTLNIKKVLLTFAIVALGGILFGQTTDDQLAAHYYQEGDYEKAAMYYKRLYEKDYDPPYYNYLLRCYFQLEKYKEAENLVKKQQRKYSDVVQYEIDEGLVLEKQGDEGKAQKLYKKLIRKLEDNYQSVNSLANSFTNAGRDELALETYLKGNELLQGTNAFTLNIAEIYGSLGQYGKMYDALFDMLLSNEGYLMSVQNTINRSIDLYKPSSARQQLKERLLKASQQHPRSDVFQEMLLWVFLQEENYHGALSQAISLDLKNQENGFRVMEIAHVAMNAEQYDAAIEATDYLIEKGKDNVYFFSSKMLQLDVIKKKIERQPVVDTADMEKLLAGYNSMLKETAQRPERAKLLKDKASVIAYQKRDLEEAKGVLNQSLNVPGVESTLRAEIKLDLADILLGLNEVWDASLLYSQVDLDFKYDRLGERAKFKNARLSYFTGDFDWAKAQLDVLKGATSKFIANDALDLSLLITDNSTIDTSTVPLQMYADAELLILQNKFDKASAKLDELLSQFPGHSISDEVYFQRYKIAYQRGDFNLAEKHLKTLLSIDDKDILADNALFKLAELYDYHLSQPEKAKEHYQRLLTDYSSSFFTTPARKRFRSLRGDKLN